MKKRIVLMLVLLLVAVFCFSACTSSDKGYQRNITSLDDLAVVMGDKLLYPNIELKGNNKFYNPADYKGSVTLPEDAKNNEIRVLYIPPITAKELAELEQADKLTYDEKAYRYSITVLKGDDYGDIYKNNGKITYYIYGSDFSKVKGADDVKLIPIEDRQKKLESDNASDKKKLEKDGLGKYYSNKIEKVGNVDVLMYENKIDGQVIMYFVDGTDCSYELTAMISPKQGSGINEYDALLQEAKTELLGYIEYMLSTK